MITRRTWLRGMLGGAVVGVALPPLQSLLGPGALAATDAFPCRFGLFFWGNGMLPDRWVPGETGEVFGLPEQLAPLEAVRSHIAVLSGLEVKVPNTVAHAAGSGGILTGRELIIRGEDWTFAGPSLDQQIAAAIGGDTAFRSLEIAVQDGARGLSHLGPDTINAPESSPHELFMRLFGPSFREPGEEGVVDPKLALRRSVLDSVMEDMGALNARIGAADRLRLDQHLTAVRDLELRLARLEEDPPSLAACMRPEDPGAFPDIDGRPQMDARGRAMADLLVMAYACDLTRVASLWFSDPLNDVLYPGANGGHHQLTHDEPGDQPMVNEIVKTTMASFAYLVEQMAAIEEGDGTLLDHSVLLATSDTSYGRTHSLDEYPMLVAGTCGGRLRNGMHYRSVGQENAGSVPLSILRALGIPAATFGEDEAAATEGLSALEAT